MQSTSVAPSKVCYYYPIPRHHFRHFPPPKRKTIPVPSSTGPLGVRVLSPSAISSCSKEQDKHRSGRQSSNPDRGNQRYLQDLASSVDTQKTQQREQKKKPDEEFVAEDGHLPNMWWADLKAAVGQRINLEGIACSFGFLSKDKHLAIPHVSVRDIRYIDWAELKKRGFKGVVFDKDNTLTIPYTLSLWPPLSSSIDQCKSSFGNNVAVFSNSAGLFEYDPDGRKAKSLEGAIGIKVIRHMVKKPAGTAAEIEKHFGCEASELIMVGDRPFTDIVFANRNGFLSILTQALSLAEEPFTVRKVRILEMAFINQWSKRGLKPFSHRLLPDPQQCIRDEPH